MLASAFFSCIFFLHLLHIIFTTFFGIFIKIYVKGMIEWRLLVLEATKE